MRNCLFSVSYAGFWGQHYLPLDAFIDKAANLGYEGIEIMCKKPHFYPLEIKDEYLNNIKAKIIKNNLKVACMAAYTNFTAGAESKEVPLTDIQISYVREIGKLAKKLDCPIIRIFTGYSNSLESYDQQWNKCIHALKECCDAVKDFGVTIGIQNHHDIGVHSKSLLELYYSVDKPNLGLMVDAWSPILREENIKSAVEMTKGKIVFVTVADYVILPRFSYNPNLVNYKKDEPPFVRAVPMGEGDLDYLGYFNALKENGYDGWVSYEMCSPLRGGGNINNLDNCATKFIKFMKENKFS